MIDRVNNYNDTYFDSWLVHIDHISSHLRLDNAAINRAIFTGDFAFSLTVGEVYISQQFISSIEWSNLIIRHPEMVHSGFSCIIDYYTELGQCPRNPGVTLGEFLYSYCR